MKFTADTKALSHALAMASRVVATRTPKPILQCVRIDADPERGLSIRSTDTQIDLAITTNKVEVESAGSVVVPAAKLLQIVKNASDATTKITSEQDVTHITFASSRFKVFGHPADDFPSPTEFDGNEYTVGSESMSSMLGRVMCACANENSRYAINGILFDRAETKLTMVATDGHRMSIDAAPCRGTPVEAVSGQTIVPKRAVEILAVIAEQGDDVNCKSSDGRISFECGPVLLATTLVEGNFPSWQDVIPKDGNKKLTIDAATLASACRRAAPLTSEESKGVRLSISADGLVMSSRLPEVGEASIDVGVVSYEGDPLEIGFNPTYLLDALKPIAGHVTIDLNKPSKPGLIRHGDGIYVAMPVNLQ